MLNPNSRTVLEYVKANESNDKPLTAADIAEGTGLGIKQVNGIVTAAFAKKGLMERIEGELEITNDEGKVSHKPVKFIRLTDAGRDFDPDAEETKAE